MDIVIETGTFLEMDTFELQTVNGGDLGDFFCALAGGLLMAAAPIVGVLAGVGAFGATSDVTVGISAGVAAGSAVANAATYFLDKIGR